jgi:hypothetical protein
VPKILVSEIGQILVYIVFGVIAAITKFELLLYFAFGFIIATSIPSILLGYGFKGIKPAIQVGNSKYENFRGLPIANGIWGFMHLVLAFFIYLNIKGKYQIGLNIETLLIFIGFCSIYFMVSISQKSERA